MTSQTERAIYIVRCRNGNYTAVGQRCMVEDAAQREPAFETPEAAANSAAAWKLEDGERFIEASREVQDAHGVYDSMADFRLFIPSRCIAESVA